LHHKKIKTPLKENQNPFKEKKNKGDGKTRGKRESKKKIKRK